jgi:hypothetical protein
MIQDANLENIYIIDINEDFNFVDMLKHINEISVKTISKLRITEKNVHIILSNFLKKVLDDKKLTVNEEVNLFIQSLVDRNNNYQHPNKSNVLVTKGFGDVKIKGSGYKSYINFFDTELSPSEKEALTATQDRLIQDETRRMKGEFFTPTIWVDEAHKMISEQFGEDWKEKYVVWDCAWGTGNLTRDYNFKELYCSTLNGSDIETANQAGYNPEATKFQYDFLNDGIVDGKINVENDYKLPEGLKNAILEGKEIIFLINPPYGRSGDNGSRNKIKSGSTDTNISKIILKEKCDGSSNLYSQFLYKIKLLKQTFNNDTNICIFSPPLFLSGPSYKKFRKFFFKSFNFKNGFLMNSSEFQDTSEWGISFSIFNDNITTNINEFEYVVKVNNGVEILSTQIKKIYNIDNMKSLSDFIKNTEKPDIFPQFTSALSIKNSNYGSGIPSNSYGTLLNSGNKVEENMSDVYLLSGGETRGKGKLFINSVNIKKIFLIFSARKLIKSNWINGKDEYLAPTEEIQQTEQYKQFESDSIVYSLFSTSSNQSSMRQVEYKDKLWDIKNEFFFMSKDEMKELAETYRFDELYKDARQSDERYVYNLLKTTTLSPDAQDVLETARELVRKSFEWRKIMYTSNPEYHLDAWDAGWYQIKKVLNGHFKSELSEFTKKYKAFEDRLRPQVYELGFLKGEENGKT